MHSKLNNAAAQEFKTLKDSNVPPQNFNDWTTAKLQVICEFSCVAFAENAKKSFSAYCPNILLIHHSICEWHEIWRLWVKEEVACARTRSKGIPFQRQIAQRRAENFDIDGISIVGAVLIESSSKNRKAAPPRTLGYHESMFHIWTNHLFMQKLWREEWQRVLAKCLILQAEKTHNHHILKTPFTHTENSHLVTTITPTLRNMMLQTILENILRTF